MPLVFDDEQSPASNPASGVGRLVFDDEAPKAVSKSRSAADIARDVGVTALKGAVGLPEAIVGLADIPTGGRVGKALEGAGVKFKETQDILSGQYSEQQQAANKKVQEADGFVNTAAAALQNPSTIATAIGESIPQMLGGAGVARMGIRGAEKLGRKVAPWIAGAVGEGTMAAGSAAENMRQESADGLLSGKQTVSALGSGAGTAILGAAGGKIAQKFGFGDMDTILAQGGADAVAAGAAKKGFLRQMAEGGISEGVFEEMPQSIQETMWQNWANDKPLMEGTGNAAAMGLLAGIGMGVGGGGYNAAMSRVAAQEQPPLPATETGVTDPMPDAMPAQELVADEPQPTATNTTGVENGATDPSGQASPVAAQGTQGASTDVPASVVDSQPGASGELAGRSGSAGISGTADGSTVPAGSAGVPGVTKPIVVNETPSGETQDTLLQSDETKPATPLTASASQPVTQQPAITMGRAEKALMAPKAITALDRVSEIDSQLNNEAIPEKRAALEQERESITASWPKAITGQPTSFSTEAGVRLEAQYALMDAGELTTSHDENLRPTPTYPPELQPRQRDRAASEMQISGIVQRLDPARLGESADAASGAPIVGADGLVESGNGRTIALKRIYQANGQRSEEYKQFLKDNAQRFGLAPEQIDGMAAPVLVRVRTTPVNRAEFARQANAATVAQMSPSEQAKSDAARIDSLEGLNPDDNGDFMSGTSRDFVRGFMARIPGTEQSGMIDAAGNLSQTGYTRLRNAVLAKAYGDSPVLLRMVESLDDNIRNLSKSLIQAAPTVAKARQSIQEGLLFDSDITPDLLAAVEELSRLKDEGKSVHDALAQAGMFGEQYSPETRELLQFLADNIRRPRKIAEFIKSYFEGLNAAGNPNQGSLLGDTAAPAKGDLMNAARRNQDGTEGIPQDRQTGQQGGKQREDAPGDQKSTEGNQEDTGPAESAAAVAVDAPAVAKTDEVDFRKQRYRNINDAEKAIKKFGLKKVGVFKDGDQFKIDTKPGAKQEDFSLTSETPEQVKAKEEAQAAKVNAEKDAADKAEAEARKERIKKEDADRKAIVMAEREAAKKAEVDATVEDFQLGQEAPEPVSKKTTTDDLAGQGDIFAAANTPAPAERFEAGSKLTKEERKSVLKTLTDVYRAKRADKEERIAANGESYLAYPHQPELFEKSDITGKRVRFYVTLPDGRIAHPTELFPDYSQADVDRAIAKQFDEDRVADQNKKYRLETLNRRMADSLNEANRIFNKENPGRDYVPAILTNGKQFIRTAPENAANDVELLGGDWRTQDGETIPEQKAPDSAEREFVKAPDGSTNFGEITSDKKPYPEGDERKAINSAFDNLFSTIQTKETDNGVALFSRNAGSGITQQSAQAIADRISAANKNMPNVRVFASPAELDRNSSTQAALYAEIESAGALKDVEGAAHDGEIYLFSDHLADDARAEHVLAIHEVTHHGLRKVFGAELNPILQSIWANNANVRKQAAALGERLGLKSNTAAVEEVLADMKPADLVKLNGWRKLAQFMREWFQNHGFTALAGKLDGMLKAGMTEQQKADMLVADVVNAARDWVKGGKRAGKVGSGTALQRVFHGTPHTFMPEPGFPHGRPRLDKIALLERNGEKLDAMREAETSMSRTGDTITVDGKQRSRLNSNGKPIAQTEEGLRNFWRWFGSSRVVDEQGRPLVVYHGTTRGLFAEFKLHDRSRSNGFVFTSDRNVALTYSGQNNSAEPGQKNPTKSGVYEAYISSKNPKILDWAGADFGDNGGTDAAIQSARDDGFDGVVMQSVNDAGMYRSMMSNRGEVPENTGISDLYVAFSPTQIKSATGNRGTFDGGNADIRFSRASQSKLPGVPQSPPVQPPSQQAMPLQSGAAGNQSVFNTPEPSKMDDIIFKLQDKHIDLKRAIQGITDAGRQIADKWNTYMQEELFHGRSAKRVKDFADRELAPMLREMALRKVSIADLDKYLWARHAKEANALIEQRDPGVMVDDVTGQPKGSGMTDQEADDYFAGLSQDQRNQLDAIAKKVDDMLVKTRELYVSYGLENRDTVQGWADMFQHYVPLMREDHDGGMGIGQGFSIKGREAKHRTGSTRAVADVLANIATQRERAIVRGEKNRVAVSLAGLVKLNPAPDFWTLDKIPQERVLNEKTGQVETREVPNYRTRDNVIIAKIKDRNGNVKERAIVLNERDERAVRLAKSMKNIDIPMLEGWLGSAAAVTRYFSAINTQYNPVFGAINLIRDVGAGALNLSSTALKGKESIVTNPKRIASAVKGIYSDARKERKGQAGTSAWSQLWEDFTEQGGQTGYRDMFKTSNDRADAMQMVMDPTSWTESKWGKFFTANGALKVPLLTVQKAATPLFDWLSDYNLAMENAVRLSAYKEAIDSGMSKPQAASLAKNLTVNFNRKGAYGAQAGALYAFFNAATQGSARIGETLTRRDHVTGKYSVSDIGKKIIGGGIMLGAMQAFALAMAGFDDDEPPEFIRERNIVVPLPGGKYLAIPMPLGFHVIPNIGRITAETVMGRRGSAVEAVIDLAGITFEAFNPIGSAGWSMQTVAPTVLDPMAALIENKDWTGKPIAKEKFSDSDPTPGFDMARDNASAIATGIAYAINLATGGSDYTAGRISPTPDQLDYLWGQVTGGAGREFNKLYQTVESQFTDEELPPYKIPLAGRLYGDTQSKSAVTSRYYENVRDMKRHKAEYLGRREKGDAEGAREYLADNPEAKLFRAVGAYESKIQQLRSAKRKAVERGINPDRVKAIEQRTSELMDKFNQQVESAQQ